MQLQAPTAGPPGDGQLVWTCAACNTACSFGTQKWSCPSCGCNICQVCHPIKLKSAEAAASMQAGPNVLLGSCWSRLLEKATDALSGLRQLCAQLKWLCTDRVGALLRGVMKLDRTRAMFELISAFEHLARLPAGAARGSPTEGQKDSDSALSYTTSAARVVAFGELCNDFKTIFELAG